MPSPLVDSVRSLLRERAESGRLVTAAERAIMLATLAKYDRWGGMDAVDELEAAIANARRACLTEGADPLEARRAVQRLLAAARGVLDYTPPDTEFDPAGNLPEDTDRPRPRADVDN